MIEASARSHEASARTCPDQNAGQQPRPPCQVARSYPRSHAWWAPRSARHRPLHSRTAVVAAVDIRVELGVTLVARRGELVVVGDPAHQRGRLDAARRRLDGPVAARVLEAGHAAAHRVLARASPLPDGRILKLPQRKSNLPHDQLYSRPATEGPHSSAGAEATAMAVGACHERDLAPDPTPKDAQIRIRSGGPTRHVCEVSCLGVGSGPRSRNGTTT